MEVRVTNVPPITSVAAGAHNAARASWEGALAKRSHAGLDSTFQPFRPRLSSGGDSDILHHCVITRARAPVFQCSAPRPRAPRSAGIYLKRFILHNPAPFRHFPLIITSLLHLYCLVRPSIHAWPQWARTMYRMAQKSDQLPNYCDIV